MMILTRIYSQYRLWRPDINIRVDRIIRVYRRLLCDLWNIRRQVNCHNILFTSITYYNINMCGGFTCSKNALAALNILYIMVSFILIGVAVYGRASALVTNLPIISGILVCGVILILISILGLIAAVKHHQVLLFFYMIILFMLFLVQFSVACACLAVNREQQHQLAEQGWKRVSNTVKSDVQKVFSCCGFESDIGNSTTPAGNPPCLHEITTPCIHKLQNTINYAFKLCGGIGLFFSFTEVVALVVAFRYRNQHNPRAKLSSAILPLPSVVRAGTRPHMYYNLDK